MEDVNTLGVSETELIVVSPQPFTLSEPINPACVSNYSERSFVFNLTDCYPDIQVRRTLYSIVFFRKWSMSEIKLIIIFLLLGGLTQLNL